MSYYPITSSLLPPQAVAALVAASKEMNKFQEPEKYLDLVVHQIKTQFPQYFKKEL